MPFSANITIENLKSFWNRHSWLWLLLIIFHSIIIPADAQSVSNAGTEFWSVFPTHEPDGNNLANLSVFITGSQASTGKITVGTFSSNFAVTANQVTEIKIPRASAYINDYDSSKVLSNRAIHVLVDSGKPKVVVYSHIFAGRRSAASLILPKEALGQQYYSMNFTQDDAGFSYITVVATQPNTKLHFRKGQTELIPGGVTLSNINDAYEYLSPSDLTGVSVSVDSLTSGCNNFALFSGSSGIRIGTTGCDPQSIDPLYQQDYPVTSWGKNYGFIPFSMKSSASSSLVRTAGQFVRILAKENGTSVTINNQTLTTLNAGEYYTPLQPLNAASYITADKPISVAQYALTQSCSNITANANSYSDPDMVLLNPIEYNINHITVYSSTKENITEQYINILIKTSVAPSFRVNNALPSVAFNPLINLPGYSYLQLPLNNLGTNNFNLAADEGFNAVAYGFGNVESYSYSAGTNLAANQSINAVETNSKLAIDSTCINNDYFFKLTLPYATPQISWQLDANETPTIQNNPNNTTSLVEGITYYSYTFPKTPAYQLAGKHKITVLTKYPATLGGCSLGQQQINASFTVIPVPVVTFKSTPEKCHNIIDFTDQTTNNTVNGIANRVWDFGDGFSSNLANPVHAYADSGKYTVKLTVSFTTGCQDSKIDTIHIRQKTVTGFSISDQDCVGKAVTFTDTSKVTDFTISTRIWYFGDGDSLLVNSSVPFQHTFAKSGVYAVKLVLVNAEGCASPAYTHNITIHDNPIPDFKLPGICLTDQVAQFTDQTNAVDSTKTPLTYLWNFGDVNANALNPDTSTAKNPSHRYSLATNYTVTLTVTSAFGCSATITKVFTVNGVNPKASFQLLSNQVCANEAVVVKNTSSVDFGSITKLEWHFDNQNQPDSIVTINNPIPGQIISHRYPIFHSPLSKTYIVRLSAYSGNVCVADTFKTVLVLATPQVRLDSLANVCLSDSPFKITQGGDLSGLSGTGIYSGDGISPDGTFNPKLAKAGAHRIQYKFTSASGCADSMSRQIVVITNPTVDAGADLRIFAGDHIGLTIRTTGENLTYKWTPATGLDHDNIANPIATPDNDITYLITVSNGICSITDDIHITVSKSLFIPNTVTANGDGVNDVWKIKNLNYFYPNAKVQVFTRWGKLIFESTGYSIPWDGNYKGQPMPAATYYYIIDIGSPQKLSGWLLLMR